MKTTNRTRIALIIALAFLAAALFTACGGNPTTPPLEPPPEPDGTKENPYLLVFTDPITPQEILDAINAAGGYVAIDISAVTNFPGFDFDDSGDGRQWIVSAKLPNTFSANTIPEHAFVFCTSLTSVTIPASVTVIGPHPFVHCTSLTSITIPNSVISIKDGAFIECMSLTNITIPANVEDVGQNAFAGCTSLTSVTFAGDKTTVCHNNWFPYGISFEAVYTGKGTYTLTGETWTKTS